MNELIAPQVTIEKNQSLHELWDRSWFLFYGNWPDKVDKILTRVDLQFLT